MQLLYDAIKPRGLERRITVRYRAIAEYLPSRATWFWKSRGNWNLCLFIVRLLFTHQIVHIDKTMLITIEALFRWAALCENPL